MINMQRSLSDCHKNYLPYLLQLTKRAKINNAVKVIPLPTSGKDLKPGTTCRVAGWGETENYMKKHLSDTLKEVNVTVISRTICNDKKHYNYNPRITKNMICAGGSKREKADSCEVSIFIGIICFDYIKNTT